MRYHSKHKAQLAFLHFKRKLFGSIFLKKKKESDWDY